MEAEQRLTARLRAAETACSAAQDAERAARGHAGAAVAASAAAREAATRAAGDAAEARQQCELERRRCASAAPTYAVGKAPLAFVNRDMLCQLCTSLPCRAASLAVERDNLLERLASCQPQADARERELEAAAREWQEKAYSAQEDVRSLAAELQELQVSYVPLARSRVSKCACNPMVAQKVACSSRMRQQQTLQHSHKDHCLWRTVQ